MAEEKGVTSVQWDCTPDTSDAATFMSLWDNGFILRNAGEYLSLFEVSQFLTTCKEWKRMFKSKIEPIKFQRTCFRSSPAHETDTHCLGVQGCPSKPTECEPTAVGTNDS